MDYVGLLLRVDELYNIFNDAACWHQRTFKRPVPISKEVIDSFSPSVFAYLATFDGMMGTVNIVSNIVALWGYRTEELFSGGGGPEKF